MQRYVGQDGCDNVMKLSFCSVYIAQWLGDMGEVWGTCLGIVVQVLGPCLKIVGEVSGTCLTDVEKCLEIKIIPASDPNGTFVISLDNHLLGLLGPFVC